MSFSRSMIVKCILSVVGLMLIPVVIVNRGYPAVGGEMFLPVYPFILWELWNVMKEIIEVLKGGETDD